MKNILVIILFCALNQVKAQSIQCPQLNSFTGEWRYVNGQDTIRVYLRSHDYVSTYPDSSSDITYGLWGWHEYKKGSVMVESNYVNRFMVLPANYENINANSYSIFLQMYSCDGSKHRLVGRIDDISQCYEMKKVTIQFNDAKNQLIWHQEHAEGYGVFSGCTGMTLPKDFVLTKL